MWYENINTKEPSPCVPFYNKRNADFICLFIF